MTDVWQLPVEAVIGGKTYHLHTDYRDILEIIGYLEDPALPEFLRWQIGAGLFFEEPMEQIHLQEALEYMARFIRCGEGDKPGPKLLDWQQDAPLIIADINRVSGQEIRGVQYMHWWTFLSWFHGIGQGQLSTVVAIREKLRKGKKLEDWERQFYRENKAKIDLQKRYTRQELEERERLERMLEN